MNGTSKTGGANWFVWCILGSLVVLLIVDLTRPSKITTHLEFEFFALPRDNIYSRDLEPAKGSLKELINKINAGISMSENTEIRNGAGFDVQVSEAGRQQFKLHVHGHGTARAQAFCDDLTGRILSKAAGWDYRTSKGNLLALREKPRQFKEAPNSLILRTAGHWPEAKDWLIDRWYKLRGKTRPPIGPVY